MRARVSRALAEQTPANPATPSSVASAPRRPLHRAASAPARRCFCRSPDGSRSRCSSSSPPPAARLGARQQSGLNVSRHLRRMFQKPEIVWCQIEIWNSASAPNTGSAPSSTSSICKSTIRCARRSGEQRRRTAHMPGQALRALQRFAPEVAPGTSAQLRWSATLRPKRGLAMRIGAR